MITELYTFSPGSYVVAEEWNANFRTLEKANILHAEAITDAFDTLAFPNGDLSGVFSAVRARPNSFAIPGSAVTVAAECEYYKTLASGEDLVINIPAGMDAEARILLRIQDDRSLLPFSINYVGTSIINYGFYKYNYFRAGYYYVMIYEAAGIAQVKLVWTGV